MQYKQCARFQLASFLKMSANALAKTNRDSYKRKVRSL